MIYFASDIHLGGGDEYVSRAKEQRFVTWLDRMAVDAEAIFLLGDIFDFWFEYQGVVPKGFVRTLGKLAELTDRGIRVVFLAGNHDMWVGDYLLRECGVEVYTAPQVMLLNGRQVFMAHGDAMGVSGEPRVLNRIFRSRSLRWFFSWFIHPDWAMRFGHWWSGKSRKSHDNESFDESITDPLVAYAREYARNNTVDHFVFGHMHFPRDFREEGLHSIHLGCWDKIPTYAELDHVGNMTLKTFES
ncbi:MAG: UDP-2,3-diacylglucosamine diphosphatase [Rikenellaceae bacterium]|nr:UDP-2,3-diacylglucosamine diphosphatase [Rikenellaceae bacterium]